MSVTVLRRALTSVAAAALALMTIALPTTAAAQAPPAVPYYVVSSSYQGQPEFLYEIAQRFLGNGNRATDIFTLNKGHQEPDGNTVSDPTVIRPGWILQLPPDAKGDGVITGTIPTVHFGSTTTPVKYYWIADSYQGKPEFLAEIAGRVLGNQNRAQDIFNLNKGRTEPDGKTLTDPAKVSPGWFVQLPDDAQGDGIIAGPLPLPGAASAGQPPASQSTASAPASSAPASAPHTTAAPASTPATPSPAKKSSGSALGLILAIVLPVLVLAGLVFWGLRTGTLAKLGAEIRTRTQRTRKPAPAAPRDEAAAWTIDRVLRTLATACARLGRPLPGVAAVVVGADTITLRLARPDEQPPEGWSAEHQGRSWSAPMRALQSAPVDDALPAPYPRLVSTGDSDQGRVLLNLAEAHGVIALDGDSRLARALAADWVQELSGSPWSRGITVLRIGFGPNSPGGAELPNVEDAPSIESAAPTLDEADAGVLLLAHAPSGREPDRLATLAGAPDGRWSVLVLGNPKNAGWHLIADTAGTLDTGLLGEPIRLHGKRQVELA